MPDGIFTLLHLHLFAPFVSAFLFFIVIVALMMGFAIQVFITTLFYLFYLFCPGAIRSFHPFVYSLVWLLFLI